jgi:tetratricopeptide (TPR) repeat protein
MPTLHNAHFRHAAHYLEVLRGVEQKYLHGGESANLLLRGFDLERPNIEAAQSWTARHTIGEKIRAEMCVDYALDGVNLLLLRVSAKERIRWLDAALMATRDRVRKGVVLGSIGVAYAELGETEMALNYYEQWLSIVREAEYRQGESQALGNMGLAYLELGDLRKALECFSQDLAISREIRNQTGESQALGNVANAWVRLGKPRKAILYNRRCLTIARAIGDRLTEGRALGNIGAAYATLGEYRKALNHLDEALVIARQIGEQRLECDALSNVGHIHRRQGNPSEALRYFEQVIAVAREAGDRGAEAHALQALALAHRFRKDEQAVGHAEEVPTIVEGRECHASSAQSLRHSLQEHASLRWLAMICSRSAKRLLSGFVGNRGRS